MHLVLSYVLILVMKSLWRQKIVRNMKAAVMLTASSK